MNKRKIVSITNLAPLYRQELWMKLTQRLGVEFWCDKRELFGIKVIDFSKNPEIKVRAIKNSYIRKVMVWQSSVLARLIARMRDTEVVLVLGEMYCVTNWLVLIICKIKSVPTVIWTHGLYGNEGWFKKKMRCNFYKLASHVLTYGNRSRDLLIKEIGRVERITTIYNSLSYDEHLGLRISVSADKAQAFPFFKDPQLPCLIFIGRLTEIKRLDLLADAYKELDIPFNLLVIGDGPMKAEIQAQLSEATTAKRVYFYGALYNEEEIASLLFNADLCVSPGNVGLTCIHALSFGTPVCTHSDLSEQMPEVEAIIPGYNGFLFEPNSSNSIKENILSWFDKAVHREQQRIQCYEVIDHHYNPKNQLEIFSKVIDELTGR